MVEKVRRKKAPAALWRVAGNWWRVDGKKKSWLVVRVGELLDDAVLKKRQK
jgi:hypothetical protein